MRHPRTEEDWIERNPLCESNFPILERHPHIDKLIKILKKIEFENILDIGCGCGVELSRIQKEFPKIEIAGIDINQETIDFCKYKLNGDFKVGQAESLPYPDKSFDIVMTDAVLIYIPSEKIEQVINEMKRVVKKALVMVEWHDNRMTKLGNFVRDHWVRDYEELLGKIETIKIDDFKDEGWLSFGNIILWKF
jgi:ubiquinone/menaquinone biosynthesis C-methylase UbiE